MTKCCYLVQSSSMQTQRSHSISQMIWLHPTSTLQFPDPWSSCQQRQPDGRRSGYPSSRFFELLSKTGNGWESKTTVPSDNRVIRPNDMTDVFIVLDVDLMLLFLGMGFFPGKTTLQKVEMPRTCLQKNIKFIFSLSLISHHFSFPLKNHFISLQNESKFDTNQRKTYSENSATCLVDKFVKRTPTYGSSYLHTYFP